jgi:5-oxoprolinase (ATP-hydrolysing) subunit A
MPNIDLNCDLGEHEGLARRRALMRWITSANVACGGHAGNRRSMESCVRLARQFNVRLGAHPGVATKFGRGSVKITPEQLEALLREQVGTLADIARSLRVKLHHIKLHGSLYHATDRDKKLAARYIETVTHLWPRAIIYARAGGLVSRLARSRGIAVWDEVFADRRYQDDGFLVPRDRPNALVTDLREVRNFLERLQQADEIVSVSGKVIAVKARTICVHSDTPNAVRIAAACRRFLAAQVW